MEDRYLFRAKRIDTGEWIIGSLLVDKQQDIETGEQIEIIGIYPSEYKDFAKKVDPSTVCQCTGLKDKNGKLIWENDIVKDLFSDACAQIKYGSYQSCFDSTKTEHVGFYVDWSVTDKKYMRKDLGYWINMVDSEVIGNTFDNPELLEV